MTFAPIMSVSFVHTTLSNIMECNATVILVWIAIIKTSCIPQFVLLKTMPVPSKEYYKCYPFV